MSCTDPKPQNSERIMTPSYRSSCKVTILGVGHRSRFWREEKLRRSHPPKALPFQRNEYFYHCRVLKKRCSLFSKSNPVDRVSPEQFDVIVEEETPFHHGLFLMRTNGEPPLLCRFNCLYYILYPLAEYFVPLITIGSHNSYRLRRYSTGHGHSRRWPPHRSAAKATIPTVPIATG